LDLKYAHNGCGSFWRILIKIPNSIQKRLPFILLSVPSIEAHGIFLKAKKLCLSAATILKPTKIKYLLKLFVQIFATPEKLTGFLDKIFWSVLWQINGTRPPSVI